jgi:hypothetical protein
MQIDAEIKLLWNIINNSNHKCKKNTIKYFIASHLRHHLLTHILTRTQTQIPLSIVKIITFISLLYFRNVYVFSSI